MGQEANPHRPAAPAPSNSQLLPLPGQILEQLERILASPPFRTSKRCSDLLRHVVSAASRGHVDFLKERTLGIAVFERDPEYDTNADPVVRNTAGQVRKRLAQYYCETGRDQELRIDLPPGAYVPQIYQPAVHPPAIAEEPRQVVTAGPRRRRWPVALASILLLAIGSGAFYLRNRPVLTKVDQFWAPMVKQAGPVVLCVGQGHTYKLKGNRDRLFQGDSTGTAPPAGSILLSDIVPIWDRSIGINDAHTLARLAALFGGFGKAVEFRGGRSTSLTDLRGKSTVLIGAFNNSWTLSLTGELRFYFDEDSKDDLFLVRDRLHPQARDWEVSGNQPANQDHVDYAIVSRVYNPTTERFVVVAAGIQGGGTAAAGELLTSAVYLDQALAHAPNHWDTRNLQFVLKTRLIGGTPGPPEVIADHYW